MQLMRGYRINDPTLSSKDTDENKPLKGMTDAEILASKPMNEKTDFSMVQTMPEWDGMMRRLGVRGKKMTLNNRSDPYRSFSPSALRDLIKM